MTLPRCGLVIATYLEQNQKYLDECLKSIKNLNYPKELIEVVIVSSGEYTPNTHGYRNIHKQSQTHYPAAVNIGVESFKDCEYYLLLNDDTVLTSNSLANLVKGAEGSLAIHQPISNCDQGWRYYLPMPLQINQRFYRYEQFGPIRFGVMMNANSEWPMSFIITDWVALYATLIPKKVWDIVGPLDPKFKTGQDDVDYCRRAKAHNIPCFINLSALIWHAGGVSADVALTPEIRQENLDYFRSKYNGDMPI